MKNIYYLCSVQIFKRYIDIAKKLTIFVPTYANYPIQALIGLVEGIDRPLWVRYLKESQSKLEYSNSPKAVFCLMFKNSSL